MIYIFMDAPTSTLKPIIEFQGLAARLSFVPRLIYKSG